MPPLSKLSLVFAILWWAPLAVAQNTLGALFDAGAAKISTQEFSDEIVQRMMAGPTAAGGTLEVMYAKTGAIAGRGTSPSSAALDRRVVPIVGEWKFDEAGRICTSMRIESILLPYRCQYWFRLGDKYFLSDSDSDRSAKILVRTLKQ